MELARVLVTGGAGFIGSNVVRELVGRGYKVVVLDNLSNSSIDNIRDVVDRITFIRGDIRDGDAVSRAVRDVDVVIHLAALIDVGESVEKPLLYHDVNVYGTHILLESCVRSGSRPRIIYASSCAVYGEPRTIPIPESHEPNPVNPYGLSKLLAEHIVSYYSRTYGLRSTIFRIFNAYGPGQWGSKYAGVVTKFISRASRGEPPIIYGGGEQVRDFIYVGDIAKIFIEAIEKDVDGVYNLGTGRGTRIIDLARKILEIFGLRDVRPIHQAPRPGDIMKSIADISRLRKVFNTAFTDLDEGLRTTIKDYLMRYGHG